MLPIVIRILLVIHVLVSLLIILLVLMQRPKNEGLGAAFGGGATDQLFGAQTTNVLQTITRWLGGMFFCLTLLLSILYVKQGGGRSPIQEKLSAKTTIPELPAPAGPASGKTADGTVSAVGGPMQVEADQTVPFTPPLEGAVHPLDGKEPMKLELAPAKAGEAVSEPVKAEPPAPGVEKPAEKSAPVPAKPPVPPPAENKPAENKPADPAPEPKPAEPAK